MPSSNNILEAGRWCLYTWMWPIDGGSERYISLVADTIILSCEHKEIEDRWYVILTGAQKA